MILSRCAFICLSDSVDGIVRTTMAKLKFFDDDQLAQAMRARVQSLQAALRETLSTRDSNSQEKTAGVRLGFDYVVEARWPR